MHCLAVFLFAAVAFAQNSGQINGTVQDKSA